MKRLSVTPVLVLLLAFGFLPVAGQGGISIEGRGGYGFPVGDFSDDLGAESDFGFAGIVGLALTPGFGVYGGWANDRFDCEPCGSGDRVRVTGFEGGITVFFDRAGFTPWIRAGLLGHRTRMRVEGVEVRSARNLGFQGMIGLDIPFGEMISIAPSVRYNHIPAELDLLNFELDAAEFDSDIQYLSVDLGIRLHLGRGR